MLTMKRMPDAEKQELLDKLRLGGAEAFVYEAREGGGRIGYAVFENIDGRVTVTRAEYGADESLLDGLVRAGMAWLDDNGFERLYFSEELDQTLLQKLYFVTDDVKYVDSVGEFLKTCKKCRM